MGEQTESKNDTYLLARGTGPSVRLTAQHWQYKDFFGWNIHPTIRESWNSNTPIRFGDIATGNGILLLDEHRSLPPGSESFGFDISSAMFPAARTLPSGISFHILDALSDPHQVPSELVGTFDVIHIRLLVGAVADNNPAPVIKAALALLKPGGYLQWTEIASPIYVMGENEGKVPLMKGVSDDSLLGRLGISTFEEAWMVKLPKTYEELGLQAVEIADFGRPREEMWSVWATNQLDIAGEIMRAGREEYLAKLASAQRDGVYAFSVPRVVIGRKSIGG